MTESASLMELYNKLLCSASGISPQQSNRKVRMIARMGGKLTYQYYQELVYNKRVFSD